MLPVSTRRFSFPRAMSHNCMALLALTEMRLLASAEKANPRAKDTCPSNRRISFCRFEGQVSFARGLAFSADAKSLISVSANSAMQLWDIARGKENRRVETGSIYASAFSLDRKTVALLGENTLGLWD